MSRFLPVDLTGSRVVTTAAATGIGYTIAEAFLSRGARVAICDINDEALDKATKSLSGALVRHVDVARADAVAGFFADVDKEMGGVDVLVNNAGIAGPTANVETSRLRDWPRRWMSTSPASSTRRDTSRRA
jgi:NAD(P)-dependent dehydrogenase (short-subunit alcohol dehydrogenase family)